ncbi:hypothetical protein RIF29_29827 [Crotalaria pallida]|uniref:Uncharacterized protein n=1 Tax=Crotalaria pallida TaxID=3830 RepID=A0AAN9EG49_CROPI
MAWKKLARKNTCSSPPKSPNSGLKRKDIGYMGGGLRVEDDSQGGSQKLKLMSKEGYDESEAARTFDLPRFLANSDWTSRFSYSVQHLSSPASDHSPMSIRILNPNPDTYSRRGERRFFFETGWAEFEDCNQIVSEVWNTDLGPCSLQGTCGKIESTGFKLQDWSKKAIPCILKEIKRMQEKLDKIDARENRNEIHGAKASRKGNVAAHLLAKWVKHASVDRVWFDVPPAFLAGSIEQP